VAQNRQVSLLSAHAVMCVFLQVNDLTLIDHPHSRAIYALRKVDPWEEAILVVRRQVKVEKFEVTFDKANEDTSLGLVVGERQLPLDQVTTVIHVVLLFTWCCYSNRCV